MTHGQVHAEVYCGLHREIGSLGQQRPGRQASTVSIESKEMEMVLTRLLPSRCAELIS